MIVAMIVPDNVVVVDGEVYKVDLSELPKDNHIVRWNTQTKTGHIEMVDEDSLHWGNKPIKDFSPYQKFLDAWNKAKADAAQQV